MAIQKFINTEGLWIRYDNEDLYSYFQIGERDTFIEIMEEDGIDLLKELSDWIAGEEDSGRKEDLGYRTEKVEKKKEEEVPF